MIDNQSIDKAMVEIQEIYNKYDLAGYVIIVSQETSMFGMEVCPSWGTLRRVNESKVEIYPNHSDVKDHETMERIMLTCHIAHAISRLCRYGIEWAKNIGKGMESHVKDPVTKEYYERILYDGEIVK